MSVESGGVLVCSVSHACVVVFVFGSACVEVMVCLMQAQRSEDLIVAV